METEQTLRAPAKINLTLEVLRRRPDGYHGIRSVMVPIDLCDEIVVSPAAGASAFDCDVPELAAANLAQRAFQAVHGSRSVSLMLRKHIPTQGGLGGGSSDAAAVLLAGREGLFGQADGVDYLQAARSLGSDVPFFLVRTAALVEGTGERVTALGAPPPWHAVIVKPPTGSSTAEAYARLDETERAISPRSESVSLALAEALQRAQFDRVVKLMQNDFHDAVARGNPSIERAIDVLRGAGARDVLLAGSGSSVFALAQTREERDAMHRALDLPAGYRAFACAFFRSEAWRSAR